VKDLQAAMLPKYYEESTTLRMTPAAVDALQDADVAGFHSALIHLLPGFGQFPETAQEALLDMAFRLGAGGLVSKFPHLALAAKAQDWQACAEQCHRAGIQEWRNTATADLFRRAAEVANAAA
jgi:GH24 family phage-related lysozyme (muramidase)